MTNVEQYIPPSVQQEVVNYGADVAAEQGRELAAGGISRIGSARSGCPPIEGMNKAYSDAIAWLYRSHGPMVDNVFQRLEQTFGMKREMVAYVFGVVWLIYMMIGGGAQFLSNLIGFVYPCYASVLAIRTTNQEDDTMWLIYWTTFASFFLVDAFASVFLQWFPFYFILKSTFLVYLWLPQTCGAQYLYKKYVDPAFTYIEKNWIVHYA